MTHLWETSQTYIRHQAKHKGFNHAHGFYEVVGLQTDILLTVSVF